MIDEFTKQTGIKVNVSMYSDNEEMLSKVKASAPGTYDIVVPSDYMVANMITQGFLEKIDMSKVTNISNIDPSYLKQSFDPTKRLFCAVPRLHLRACRQQVGRDGRNHLLYPAF